MTPDDRVRALMRFRFTERQARFLVTVLLHSGVCLPRQYCAFASIVHGEKTRRFFARLIRRGFACDYPCRHNRGRIYHVHHRPLHAAIGEPESRLRRPMSAVRVVENLTVLDAVIATPARSWLSTADDGNLALAALMRTTADMGSSTASERVVSFNRGARDSLRMAIDPSGRPVFLYVATELPTHNFHRVLQRLLNVVDAVPAWTLRIVMPKPFASLSAVFQSAVKQNLEALRPVILRRLTWYFAQRRAHELEHARIEAEEEYDQAHEGFSAPRFQALYQRWLQYGDAALPGASFVAADAIASGAGRIEYTVLPFSYRHLSPVIERMAGREVGAEEGEEPGSGSRPPERDSSADLSHARNHGRDAGARHIERVAKHVLAANDRVERRREGRRSVPPDNSAAGTAARA